MNQSLFGTAGASLGTAQKVYLLGLSAISDFWAQTAFALLVSGHAVICDSSFHTAENFQFLLIPDG